MTSGIIPAQAGIQSAQRGHGLRLVCGLLKLRIGSVIGLTAAAGATVTPGSVSGGQLLLLALAVTGAAAAAGGFNQYVERDLDRLMQRTKNRPFVTGELEPDRRFLWLLGTLLVVSVAAAAAVANALAAAYVFVGAFFYGVVYTVWLKRRTWWNIVVGGAAGSFAVLAGAAAVSPGLPPAVPAALAVVLFLWTPPHFWSLAIVCRDDYARAGVPMLPVVIGEQRCAWIILVHTVALVAVSLLPLAYGMGWIYAAGAISGGALFIATSLRLVREPNRATARANFHASLAQLSLLLFAAILERAVVG
ncbi:MAG: heme o synthase [Betaproteobacteria bacterium]